MFTDKPVCELFSFIYFYLSEVFTLYKVENTIVYISFIIIYSKYFVSLLSIVSVDFFLFIVR